MFSIAYSSLFGQDAVYRRPAHAEELGDVLACMAIGLHPLRRRDVFGVVLSASLRESVAALSYRRGSFDLRGLMVLARGDAGHSR